MRKVCKDQMVQFGDVIGSECENHIRHKYTLCVKCRMFLVLKQAVHIVTTVLLSVEVE
jgi:hypothetical protein